MDEPAKGLRIQGQTVKKPSFSDDFWSSSTFDVDNGAFQSQRSMSSISTSTLNQSNDSEFVNHGAFSTPCCLFWYGEKCSVVVTVSAADELNASNEFSCPL